jgi:hypothetical protein
MPMTSITIRSALALLGAAAALGAGAPAHADRQAAVPPSPLYRQECGSCHTAYPPAMLPAASWQRLLANLPHHFGTDASVDAATAKQLAAWIDDHAGSGRRVGSAPADDRITRTPHFVREHRGVGGATWTRPAIKSASNCGACHPRSDVGDFDEHDIRIPR